MLILFGNNYLTLFSWHLLSSWLCKDVADPVFPSLWLAETHWSEWWIQVFYFVWEEHGHRGAVDALGDEWKGSVVLTGVGWWARFSHSQSSWPTTECPWCCERGVLVIDQGELEEGSVTLCRCIIDDNLSVLKSVVVRKGEKDILGLTDTIVLWWLGSKRTTRTWMLFKF